MFDALVQAALRNRAAVVVFTLVVAIGGWFSFRGLTIEAFPDPTDTQVQVITLFPGQPTEEVERQYRPAARARAQRHAGAVAAAQHLALRALVRHAHLQRRRRRALCARQQVLERLRDAELPEGVTPQLGPLATPIGEIYRYTLTGARGDPMHAAHAAGLGGAARRCCGSTASPTWSATAASARRSTSSPIPVEDGRARA